MFKYEKVNGDFDVKGKVAIVLGGAGGIGEAVVRMYAKKGAKVTIADTKDNVKELAAQISKEYNTPTLGLNVDDTNQASVDQMVSQTVANQMIKQGNGGKIVCITSQADFIAINQHVAYTMSKASLLGMIKVCAYEWADYGININGIAPTVVNTPLGEKAWQGKVKDDMIQQIPAKRFAEPDEIAAAVLFLSTPESNMITGEDLVVDGGFTIH